MEDIDLSQDVPTDATAKIADFCGITGASSHVAEHYLSACNWDQDRVRVRVWIVLSVCRSSDAASCFRIVFMTQHKAWGNAARCSQCPCPCAGHLILL